MVSADDYGIPFDGSTDVTASLAAAINAQSSGTFTLHPGGLYLTSGIQLSNWVPSNVTIDGQGAFLFRNVRRTGDGTTDPDIVLFNAPGSTLKNLNIYGFRKDTYPGNLLVTVAGSPTVSGTTVLLDAANEEVRLPQTPLDVHLTPSNFETPFYFRGVDGLVRFEAILSSTAGSGPALLCIYDDVSGNLLASNSVDPTGTPSTYTVTFNPSANLGTRMRVTVKKVTGTGTLTVHSITPYGEAGFRLRQGSGMTFWGGGNEFSDGVQVGAASGMTFDNVWVEGADGDGFNLTTAGTNVQILNSTVRCNGRQGYTIENSQGPTLIQDSVGRECGRSGIDWEPNGANQNYGTTLRRVRFENVRNYAISSGAYGQNHDVVLEDITVINAGMGPLFGGGPNWNITNLRHQNTYRTQADRILNGGKAGVDFITLGRDFFADGVTTDIGFWIEGPLSSPAKTTWNTHITNAVVTHPTLVPPYIVDATDSDVTMAPTGPQAVWDDPVVTWDDPLWTWDGLPFEPPDALKRTFRVRKLTGGSHVRGRDRIRGITNVVADSSTGTLAVTGTGTVGLAAGTRTVFGTLAVTGVGSANFAGSQAAGGTLDVEGLATITFAGHRTVYGTLNVVGLGTMAFAGVRTVSGRLDVTGVGVATFRGVIAGHTTIDVVGVGTASFAGVRTVYGTLAVTGVGTATFAGVRMVLVRFDVLGVGTCGFAGSQQAFGQLDITGAGLVTFAGEVLAAGTGEMVGPTRALVSVGSSHSRADILGEADD